MAHQSKTLLKNNFDLVPKQHSQSKNYNNEQHSRDLAETIIWLPWLFYGLTVYSLGLILFALWRNIRHLIYYEPVNFIVNKEEEKEDINEFAFKTSPNAPLPSHCNTSNSFCMRDGPPERFWDKNFRSVFDCCPEDITCGRISLYVLCGDIRCKGVRTNWCCSSWEALYRLFSSFTKHLINIFHFNLHYINVLKRKYEIYILR